MGRQDLNRVGAARRVTGWWHEVAAGLAASIVPTSLIFVAYLLLARPAEGPGDLLRHHRPAAGFVEWREAVAAKVGNPPVQARAHCLPKFVLAGPAASDDQDGCHDAGAVTASAEVEPIDQAGLAVVTVDKRELGRCCDGRAPIADFIRSRQQEGHADPVMSPRCCAAPGTPRA
jgi:hypothetical protein